MSVQKIVELIEREAQEEVAAIVAEAERTARQLIAAAEARVAARVSEALDRVGPEIRAESQRRINAVRLRLLSDRARVDATRLTAVFYSAEADVSEVAAGGDPGRWSAALTALCADALESVGAEASLSVRARDAALIAALVARNGAHVVEVADDAPAGVVATSRDGRVEVDATLPVRVERARALLAEQVAQALALTPGDVGPEPGDVRPDRGG